MGVKNGRMVPCTNCGKEIYRTIYRLQLRKNQFCCQQCANEYHVKQTHEDRKCIECGATFTVPRSSKKRLCSYSCQHEWQKHQVGSLNARFGGGILKCDYCGKEYEVGKYRYNSTHHHFCSTDCRVKWYAEVWSQDEEWRESSRRRAVKLLSDGVQSKTMTKPQKIMNNLLDEAGIRYKNEENYKYYAVDNYLPDYNLIIEVMGDFWHSNPIKFPDYNKLKPVQTKTASRDKAKRTYISKYYNIKILDVWEDDLYKHPELCKMLISKYIESGGDMQNYNSFNYSLIDGELVLNEAIVFPYYELSGVVNA